MADDEKCLQCGASLKALAADQRKKHAETCTDIPTKGRRGKQQRWTRK